jgi:hypothetical protein
MGNVLALRWQRLIVVPLVCIVVGIISYIAIWACYGFRYGPTHDPQVLLSNVEVTHRIKYSLMTIRTKQNVDLYAPEVDSEPLNATSKVLLWVQFTHFLPQAWIYGFLFTYASTLLRSSYLMGQVSNSGWWYYFPCAMLFKTPTATLLAIAIGIIATPTVLLKYKSMGSFMRLHLWAVVCFAISIGVYALSAMASNLNLGLRHILPVYPFIFIALGAGAAALIRYSPKWGAIGAGAAILMLMIESLLTYPNYIPFFNTPSQAIAGGINLLGDSNLDWGQDLKLLHTWQQQHTDRKMYLSYFGIADPAAYGVMATDTPARWGGWPLGQILDPGAPPPGLPGEHEQCYLAVSVTNLQGIYIAPYYHNLLQFQPVAKLGKSIYVYALPVAEDRLNKSGS